MRWNIAVMCREESVLRTAQVSSCSWGVHLTSALRDSLYGVMHGLPS